ncbi:ATP-binding protein [Undibacterium sp. TC9W]|uniref:hybrid sensor histidine kinase/response regulator n=1 Tax=Undibacterium sp. TC9W TaxID=3413053 RepID=UPI003BF2241E
MSPTQNDNADASGVLLNTHPKWAFIGSGTPMRDAVRAFDWSRTELGSISNWPAALKATVAIVMNSVHPMFLWWGPKLIQIYNDAYVPSFGVGKHPAALGQAGEECWQEIWPVIWPQISHVMNGGEAHWYEDNLVPIWRNSRMEDVYWTYTYTPVYGDDDRIAGTLVVCTETTSRILAERRQRTLSSLTERLTFCKSRAEIFETVSAVAAENTADILAVAVNQEDAAGLNKDTHFSIHALELHFHHDCSLTFELSQRLPFDAAYSKFLHEFTAVVCRALTHMESLLARDFAAAERDRLLFDAPVGTAIMLGDDLVFQLANPIYCKIIGRPEVMVVGHSFDQVFPELLDSEVRARFKQVFREGSPFVSEETKVRISLYGGEPEDRYYIYNLAPIRRVDEKVHGLMVITIDITSQVLARTEIERLNDNLNVTSRAKDEFLAMLGHELRNPLAPIVTALELMKMRNPTVSKEQAVIQRQVDHLVRLVDDLMDVSRITSGKVQLRMVATNLRDVMNKALEMASHLLEKKNHHLTLDVAPITWVGDPARLAQVVANLLTNAAKYTPDGGEISLVTYHKDDEVKICVSDNGVGISASLMPNIFDLFVQGGRSVDRSDGGLGIGLALVSNLVQLHHGSVQAESPGDGLGSSFTISLPHKLTVAVAEPQEKQAHVPSGTKARILVVDDNRDAADSLFELLSAMGHEVRAVYDPVQALTEVKLEMPEFAILDIGLPGMDGYELAKAIRELPGGSAIRLIALTGYGQQHDKERSQSTGFNAHMIKPIELDYLERFIATNRASES